MSPVEVVAGLIAAGLNGSLLFILARFVLTGTGPVVETPEPPPARPVVEDRTLRPGNGDDGREVTL